jgi:hypothetical protein
MAGVLQRLLALAALAAACPALSAQVIQTAAPPPAPPTPPAQPAPFVWPTQSGRLPPPAEAPPNLPGPYFEYDPVVDNPALPPLGWFGEADVALLAVHVKRQSFLGTPPPALPGNGYVPQGQVGPGVSPRFQVGYRLPEGFGEFSVAFRFLDTAGGNTGLTPLGLMNQRDTLHYQILDLDYASNETSLWPQTDMRWRLGLRLADAFLDSRLATPDGLPVPPDLVTDRRFTNWFGGAGPVAGLQLAHHLNDHPFSLLCRADASAVFGRLSQTYAQHGAPGPDGIPPVFARRFSSSQDVAILTIQLGGLWRPRPYLDAFVGYQYETWWNVERLGPVDSRGEFQEQGVVARLSFCW